jgi:multidrug efflux system membrane fusion protein
VRDAVLVPTAAIQRTPTSIFVYHVKPDQTVEVRNVVVQLTEGDNSAIRSGVAPGEVVVTDGVDRLRPGAKVAATMAGVGGVANPGTGGNPGGGANAAAAGPQPGAGPSPNPAAKPNAARRRAR